jgi:hypothetical protein
MVTTALVFVAAMMQQSLQPETHIDLSQLSASIEGPRSTRVDEALVFKVFVQDIDVRAFYNRETEAVRSQVVYSESQMIVADPKLRAGRLDNAVRLVRQDQMTVNRVGWDAKKKWCEYQIVVVLDKEQRSAGGIMTLAIEIQDTVSEGWLKDKSQYLGWSFLVE